MFPCSSTPTSLHSVHYGLISSFYYRCVWCQPTLFPPKPSVSPNPSSGSSNEFHTFGTGAKFLEKIFLRKLEIFENFFFFSSFWMRTVLTTLLFLYVQGELLTNGSNKCHKRNHNKTYLVETSVKVLRRHYQGLPRNQLSRSGVMGLYTSLWSNLQRHFHKNIYSNSKFIWNLFRLMGGITSPDVGQSPFFSFTAWTMSLLP